MGVGLQFQIYFAEIYILINLPGTIYELCNPQERFSFSMSPPKEAAELQLNSVKKRLQETPFSQTLKDLVVEYMGFEPAARPDAFKIQQRAMAYSGK